MGSTRHMTLYLLIPILHPPSSAAEVHKTCTSYLHITHVSLLYSHHRIPFLLASPIYHQPLINFSPNQRLSRTNTQKLTARLIHCPRTLCLIPTQPAETQSPIRTLQTLKFQPRKLEPLLQSPQTITNITEFILYVGCLLTSC